VIILPQTHVRVCVRAHFVVTMGFVVVIMRV
jgi:hypothetical protein